MNAHRSLLLLLLCLLNFGAVTQPAVGPTIIVPPNPPRQPPRHHSPNLEVLCALIATVDSIDSLALHHETAIRVAVDPKCLLKVSNVRLFWGKLPDPATGALAFAIHSPSQLFYSTGADNVTGQEFLFNWYKYKDTGSRTLLYLDVEHARP